MLTADVRPPDPEEAGDLDQLIARLRLLKAWAHDRPYSQITRAVNDGWRRAGRPASELTTRSTVAGYFAFGRSRLDEELLVAIVRALHPDPGYAERWRHVLRAIRGASTAAAFVRTRSGLPDAPEPFVGRETELTRLTQLAATSPVVVIEGMAGVGKTWLAARAARRIAVRATSWYRLHLHADLRGHDPDSPPADPSAVLADLLRHLGVRGDQIPPSLAGRIREYRARLRDRPALIVLDNAATAEHVEALLPADPSSLVLVTTRRAAGAPPSCARLRLDGLADAESLDLLGRTAGKGRIEADVEIARRIAALVGNLPLALSIIGAHLRSHPDWPLGDYLHRATALALENGVRTALARSDRELPATTRRVLRFLALHPGRDIDPAEAAALADLPRAEVHRHLEELAAAHLLRRIGTDRYALPELARAYAAERIGVDEPVSRARAALSRLLDHYRHVSRPGPAAVQHPLDVRTRPEHTAVPRSRATVA